MGGFLISVIQAIMVAIYIFAGVLQISWSKYTNKQTNNNNSNHKQIKGTRLLPKGNWNLTNCLYLHSRESAINPHISICKPPLEENMVCGPINFFKNVYIGAQVQQACGPCKAGLVCKQVG